MGETWRTRNRWTPNPSTGKGEAEDVRVRLACKRDGGTHRCGAERQAAGARRVADVREVEKRVRERRRQGRGLASESGVRWWIRAHIY
jgi:hypothetical protein